MADLAKTLCYIASLGHAVDLHRWEQPVPKKRKQLMSIPIAGVNYRNQEKEDKDQRTTDKRASITSDKPGKKPNHPEQEPRSSTPTPTIGKLDTMKHEQHQFIFDALKVLKEGLKTMQTLHMQTAETHQKFLETQTKAGRSLQQMMENAQRLAEASAGITTGSNTFDVNFEKADETTPETFEMPIRLDEAAGDDQPDALEYPQTPPDPVSIPVTADQNLSATTPFQQPADPGRKVIESNMLEVVSDLTGYPAEMLSFDMDVEADLGIDILEYLSETGVKDDSKQSIQETSDISSTSPASAGKESLGMISNDMPEPSPEYLAATIGRKVVSIVDQPLDQNKPLILPDSRKVLVTDDRNGLSEAIVNQFKARGIHAKLLSAKMFTDIVVGKKVLTNASGLVIVPENTLQNISFVKDAFLESFRFSSRRRRHFRDHNTP
jgi:hypothetical protein